MTDLRTNDLGLPRQLTDGLWVVGNHYFNLYLVRGENASALIEVGVSAVIDEVIGQLESMQIEPNYLVVTHPHPDHLTGLPALSERFPNARVIAAEGAAEFLADPRAAMGMVLEDRFMSEALATKGVKVGRPPLEQPVSLQGCETAVDGQEIDLGGITLRFIEASGHSPGTILVQVPEADAVIVSDSLGYKFPERGMFPLFFTGYDKYMNSLKRLEAMAPNIVGVAHQQPFTGDEAGWALKEAQERAQSLRDRIVNHTGDTDAIIQEIYDDFYRDECTMYSPENIRLCCTFMIKRARQSVEDRWTDEGAQ